MRADTDLLIIGNFDCISRETRSSLSFRHYHIITGCIFKYSRYAGCNYYASCLYARDLYMQALLDCVADLVILTVYCENGMKLIYPAYT